VLDANFLRISSRYVRDSYDWSPLTNQIESSADVSAAWDRVTLVHPHTFLQYASVLRAALCSVSSASS
jgi:hypothetical protein